MSNPPRADAGNLVPTVGVLGTTGFRAYQMFPCAVNVADPAALEDNKMTMLSVDVAGRVRALVTAVSGSAFTTVPFSVQSVAARATVVAPGVGAAIATIAAGSLPVGTYDVQVNVLFDVGAPVAADTNNMEFRRGAAVVTSLQVLPVITNMGPMRFFRMVMDGATALSVNATGAGTAGVGYNAALIAVRVV